MTRYLGQRIPRIEDARLLCGAGRFTGDLAPEQMMHLVVVRSEHPSASIERIDLSAAQTMPGVLGAWSGASLDAAGLGGIPWELRPPVVATSVPTGDRSIAPPQPLLARDVVRYQGEPVAIVVAASPAQALDAAERVVIDYAPDNAVIAARAAVQENAPRVWPQFTDNVCFTTRAGDAAATEAAFARAAHVTRLAIDVPRLVQNPIEPRTYVGEYDAAADLYTLYAAAGKPQPVARAIANDVFRIPESKVRVVTRDVGGGFGAKNVLYAEEALVLWAARQVGRPVRFAATRAESFLSDMQARDQSADAELALDASGRVLAMRVRMLTNLGAYLGPRGATPVMVPTRIITSVYAVPAIDIEMRAVHTHTTPTCPYRGAGAPEAILVMERLIERAGRELGIHPAAIRRRNLVSPQAIPYTNALGVIYDSGEFERTLDAAERLAAVKQFAERRAASAARGRLRGLGYAMMLESGGVGLPERADVECTEDGRLIVRIGTMSNGQSHETVYAQLLADTLGVAIDTIEIRQGDSAETPWGMGTGASRSITVGGSALVHAGKRLIETGRVIAAELLEAAGADLTYAAGVYSVSGTDRQVRLAAIAKHAAARGETFAASHRYVPEQGSYPNGCHIAEIEIDPDTGVTSVLAYSAAQDVGRALNPMVIEGQIAGGVAQGIGEALWEVMRYDADSAQVLTGSFLDYAMPRADGLPPIAIELLEVPCAHTPTGAKSVGETGTTAAPAAILNAVLDALAPFGVTEVPLPITSEGVLRALGRI